MTLLQVAWLRLPWCGFQHGTRLEPPHQSPAADAASDSACTVAPQLGQRTGRVQVMAPVRICQPEANTGVQDARSTGTTQQFGLSWQVSLQHPPVTYDETQRLNVTLPRYSNATRPGQRPRVCVGYAHTEIISLADADARFSSI